MRFLKEEELDILKTKNIVDALSEQDMVIVEAIEGMVIDEIRMYLNGRYDCDLIFSRKEEERSPFILRVTLDLLLYYLYKRLSSDDMPAYVVEGYDNHIKVLNDIALGKLNPNLPLRDSKYEATTITFGNSKPLFYNGY